MALFGSTEGGGMTTGLVLAWRSIEADYAPPGSIFNRQAHDPPVPGVPLAALFAQNHEETGPPGSAAHFLGRQSIGGGGQLSLSPEHNKPPCPQPPSVGSASPGVVFPTP